MDIELTLDRGVGVNVIIVIDDEQESPESEGRFIALVRFDMTGGPFIGEMLGLWGCRQGA